jgi:hypothetical protein
MQGAAAGGWQAGLRRRPWLVTLGFAALLRQQNGAS